MNNKYIKAYLSQIGTKGGRAHRKWDTARLLALLADYEQNGLTHKELALRKGFHPTYIGHLLAKARKVREFLHTRYDDGQEAQARALELGITEDDIRAHRDEEPVDF